MDPAQANPNNVGHRNFNLHVPINLGAVMLIIFLLVGAGIGYFVAIQTAVSKEKKTLSIIGVGVVEVKPDTIEIKTFYQEGEYLSVEQANKDLALKQERVRSVLKPYNIPNDAIIFTPSSSKASLYPSPSPSTGYLDVTVTLRDVNLAKAGQIEAALVAVGPIDSSEIIKNVEYKYEHKVKAREDALKDAENQLNTLMKKNKLRVDKVTSFKETSESARDKYDGYGAPKIGEKIALDVGEDSVNITASYEIVYSLK